MLGCRPSQHLHPVGQQVASSARPAGSSTGGRAVVSARASEWGLGWELTAQLGVLCGLKNLQDTVRALRAVSSGVSVHGAASRRSPLPPAPHLAQADRRPGVCCLLAGPWAALDSFLVFPAACLCLTMEPSKKMDPSGSLQTNPSLKLHPDRSAGAPVLVPEQGGYKEKFVKTVEDKYKCEKCQLVLCNPKQTECGHRFCDSCMATVLR